MNDTAIEHTTQLISYKQSGQQETSYYTNILLKFMILLFEQQNSEHV